MGLVYDRGFVEEVQEQVTQYAGESDKFMEYSIDFPEGLNDPPLREIAKLFEDGGSFEVREKIAKYCILKKPVVVRLDATPVDPGFVMNVMTDDWDAFPTMRNHALAFTLLLDICSGHVLKKFMPSMRSTTMKKKA